MPTLNRRVDKTEQLHPRQTKYYITAKPPDIGFITYQIDPRAVEFLVETRDYGDGDRLSWSLVHPLRQIRDLYTLDEGRPRSAEPRDNSSNRVTTPSLETDEIKALVKYLREHPDVDGDIQTFESQIKQQDGSYTEAIEREGYTPVDSPGFDATGNETLDKIAEQYFGDETSGYISWDGKRIYDYIKISDREGKTHQFPEIESRLPEGELLRLSRDIYERWGPKIGEAEVNSRRYEPGKNGFPNQWIGQREDAPEPNLERAKSPMAFYYRTIAGRSHYAPGTEAERAFEQACEYSLEVYKANFPTAVDPNDLKTKYVTVEEATEPWDDFQVPPGWQEKYAQNGGIPPLKRDATNHLPGRAQDILDRHGPNGTGNRWFSSIEECRELLERESYRQLLVAADRADQSVIDVFRSGAGGLVFEVEFETLDAIFLPDREEILIYPTVESGDIFILRYNGDKLTGLQFPEADSDLSTVTELLENLSHDLPSIAEFADNLSFSIE